MISKDDTVKLTEICVLISRMRLETQATMYTASGIELFVDANASGAVAVWDESNHTIVISVDSDGVVQED